MRKLVRYAGDGRYEIVEGDLAALFGPPRERGGPIEPHHCDIAHALQLVLEEATLQAVEWLAAQTGEKQLAMAGGVALNCVMNAKIRDRGPFDDVWVQPAAGDAGTALGAALWTDFRSAARAATGAWTTRISGRRTATRQSKRSSPKRSCRTGGSTTSPDRRLRCSRRTA
jgi:carbamoyltransferase